MKRRAFTLVELMLAISITSLLILVLVNLASTASNAWQRGQSQADTFSAARGALTLLGREMQGAVVDLDIGFRIDPVDGDENNFVLKFLSRRDPITDPTADRETTVEMVAYQGAWANNSILPEITDAYDADHPIPVLIRTSSSSLTNIVFNVPNSTERDWTKRWGSLDSGIKLRAGQQNNATKDVIEVVADNVMGWKVIPLYWDGNNMTADTPSTAKYYTQYLTSDKAPRALEVKLAVVSGGAIPRISNGFSEWKNIRSFPQLFNLQDLPNGPFNTLLKQNTQFFDATIYLSSKTP